MQRSWDNKGVNLKKKCFKGPKVLENYNKVCMALVDLCTTVTRTYEYRVFLQNTWRFLKSFKTPLTKITNLAYFKSILRRLKMLQRAVKFLLHIYSEHLNHKIIGIYSKMSLG